MSAASASRSSPVKSARSWRTRALSAAVSARTVSAAVSSTFLPERSRSCARAMRSSSSGTRQLQRAAVDRQALADERRQPRRVRQRVVEQQPPPLVRDGRAQRRDERVQPRAGAIAGQRALGRHREDRRLGHDRRQVLAREAPASRPAPPRRADRPWRRRRSADRASSAGCAPRGTAARTRSGSASRRAGRSRRRRAAGSRR